jgi:hypothetical protein
MMLSLQCIHTPNEIAKTKSKMDIADKTMVDIFISLLQFVPNSPDQWTFALILCGFERHHRIKNIFENV